MAKNKKGTRIGAVKNRTQTQVRDVWVKKDAAGNTIGVKKDGTPFKGVTKNP